MFPKKIRFKIKRKKNGEYQYKIYSKTFLQVQILKSLDVLSYFRFHEDDLYQMVIVSVSIRPHHHVDLLRARLCCVLYQDSL